MSHLADHFKEMVEELKLDTMRWQEEKAKQSRSSTYRYMNSKTWADREVQGAGGQPVAPPRIESASRRDARRRVYSHPQIHIDSPAAPEKISSGISTTLEPKDSTPHSIRSSPVSSNSMRSKVYPVAESEIDRTYIPVGHWFSSFAKDFADIEVNDHAACKRFVVQHPDVFQLDARDFLREALAALRTQRSDYARRCVQRAVLLNNLLQKTPRERLSFFAGLIESDKRILAEFHDDQDSVMDKLRLRIPQVTESILGRSQSVAFVKDKGMSKAKHDFDENDKSDAIRSDAAVSISKQTGSLRAAS